MAFCRMTNFRAILGGSSKQDSPRIKPVLQMMEPTAFPRARLDCPRKAARTETATSGVVVPRLTMVAPITTFGMRERSDRLTAAEISQSAAFPRMSRLPRITPVSRLQWISDRKD